MTMKGREKSTQACTTLHVRVLHR